MIYGENILAKFVWFHGSKQVYHIGAQKVYTKMI